MEVTAALPFGRAMRMATMTNSRKRGEMGDVVERERKTFRLLI